ncbi:hypothetical protein [Parabacteroides sp. PF5-9]|uniref:hypothetical protein n=1 Tax=Parabacteroides sp. PF5-9 TaxID=1742404 RepID=UPI00247531E3|nr:hypothetical protein [Parabacteroides sp. PF5-9]MDH6356406.1 hypothetical protein [Parabacteroides sp. PF5-9]
MGLFKPAWQSKKPEKRMAAVEKIDDQQKLETIVLQSVFPDTCLAALKKITGQEVLGNIVLLSTLPEVRSAALERITDQEILFKVVKEHRSPGVARMALVQITDQEILKTIILSAGILHPLKIESLGLITDKQILREIIRQATHYDLTVKALLALGDQLLLAEIGRNWYANDQYKAMKKLRENDAILHFLMNTEYRLPHGTRSDFFKHNEWDRKIGGLIDKMKGVDNKQFYTLAEKAKDPTVQKNAIQRIDDEQLLIQIALESAEEWIIRLATERITDLEVLIGIALEYPGRPQAIDALRKIEQMRLGKTKMERLIPLTAVRRYVCDILSLMERYSKEWVASLCTPQTVAALIEAASENESAVIWLIEIYKHNKTLRPYIIPYDKKVFRIHSDYWKEQCGGYHEDIPENALSLPPYPLND